MTERHLVIDGSNIYYRVYGAGKPVILVHGFGETGDVWKNQAGFLSSKFCIIVPDLPGSGHSDFVDDMSMEGLCDVLLKIITTELNGSSTPAGKVSMIGHSMGGYVALAFLEKYSTYLSGFGLFHSSAFADNEDKKATRRKGIEFVARHGAYEFLKNTSPNLFSPISREKRPELIDEFVAGLRNFSAQAIVLYYEAMMQRPDRTHLLKTTPLTVLLLLGKYDNAVPFEDGLRLAHMPEKAYIHILYQSGHMGMLEEPDESNHILEKFLNET
jgi:pimeloyl-ACP methyl ester carboxylesterase